MPVFPPRGLRGYGSGVDARRLRVVERVSAHVDVAVDSGDRTVVDEVAPALLEGLDVAAIVAGVHAGHVSESGHRVGPTRGRRLEVAVGAEGGKDPSRPLGVSGESGVSRQVVARIVVVASAAMRKRS